MSTGKEKRLTSEDPIIEGQEREVIGWYRGVCMHEKWLQFVRLIKIKLAVILTIYFTEYNPLRK